MNGMLRGVLDLLYPPRCMLCRCALPSSAEVTCGACDGDLPDLAGSRSVMYFEQCIAPFSYEEPIRGAILRFKFHGQRNYVQQFAKWMAAQVCNKLTGTYDVISWVPCSRRRKWKRGFDQSELLAKALAQELGMEAVPTLRKRKHNKKQSLTAGAAQRRANVVNVYRAENPQGFRGKRILLLDDVLTTGATLSECGKTLMLAGAGSLSCVVIAAAGTEKDK